MIITAPKTVKNSVELVNNKYFIMGADDSVYVPYLRTYVKKNNFMSKTDFARAGFSDAGEANKTGVLHNLEMTPSAPIFSVF